jgi:L-alanine-DL-glutamate epimerase-like enolase superfamily enzyme
MDSERTKGGDMLSSRGSEIQSIDCYPARLPLRKPLVMSTYRIDDGPVLFVRLRSTNGAEGWGEAPANPIMSGETLPGMQAIIENYMKPRLIGRSALDRKALLQEIRAGLYGNTGALTAIDLALLDLAGRILGVSAVDLLGGAVRRRVRPLWLIGGSGNPEQDVDEAIKLRQQGFTAFKLKVGVAPLETEITCVKMLREALGPDVLLSADANMGWDVATSIRFTQSVARYGIAFLEQPTRSGDVSRIAAVSAVSPIPIGADESIHSTGDLLAHVRAKAIGGASLKSIKLGGVSAVVNNGHLCDALGLSVNLAMLMESSLATAAMVHAACAIPQVDWGLSLGHLWLAEDPVHHPLVCVDGMIDCPQGPGLGVTVDERRIAALAC